LLISVVADSLYIRLVFRAQGGSADVVRAVDITWQEARDLQRALAGALQEHAQRPAEEHSRWDLAE
jgi:hypothetical protein